MAMAAVGVGIIRAAAPVGRVVQALARVAVLVDDPVPGSDRAARQPLFVATFHHGALEHDVNRTRAAMSGLA
ncbi:hypothetical protein PSCICL_41740 [Pseudomonas cichorii]|nr:hypothetical protein PSCICL_41740 [Pseudomonas cichorii]